MTAQKISERLAFHNPWWAKGNVSPPLIPAYRRPIFAKLIDYLKLDRVIVLKGPRRTGKSTLFYQLIDHLITKENVLPLNICHLTFDDPLLRIDLLELLKYYEKILGVSLENEEIKYLFLDEVPYLPNWASLVKIIFDRKLPLKIFVSGSSASLLIKQSESLAGRTIEETILPLNFPEWLNYFGQKSLPVLASHKELAFSQFAQKSGFMNLLNVEDKEIREKMLLEDVVTKAIYKDAVEIFGLREPAILEKMLTYLASSTGGLVNLSKLSSMLGIDRTQTGRYLTFLENTLLVFPLRKYSRQVRETLRSQEKIHLVDQGFGQIFSAPKGSVLESIVARAVWEKYPRNTYFWRDRLEVDIVLEKNDYLIPIEVKAGETIGHDDLAGLLSFAKEFGAKTGFVVYSGEFKKQTFENLEITFVPIWDFLANVDSFLPS